MLSNLIACGGSFYVTNGFLGVSYEKNALGEWFNALSGDLTGTTDSESSIYLTIQWFAYNFLAEKVNLEKSYAIYKSFRFFLFLRVEFRSRLLLLFLLLLLFITIVWFLFRVDLRLLPSIESLFVISDLFGIVIVWGLCDEDPSSKVKVYSAVRIVFLADGFCFKNEADYMVVSSKALIVIFLLDESLNFCWRI